MYKRLALSAIAVMSLAACGGGGSGPPSGGGGGGGGQSAASVSGDMLGMNVGRGWNYQTIGVTPASTVSTYNDPSGTPGEYVLLAAGVSGTVPTVLTSAANVDANLLGALGFVTTNNSYSVGSELSYGSVAAVPGEPLLVPSTLTQGQTWTPYLGATATVTSVGAMPNASACPLATTGAAVRYTYPGFDETISYVPGCGITDLKNNTSAAEFALVSVGAYGSLGSLDVARRVESASMLDTARSLMGLERGNGAKSLPGIGSIL